MEGSAVWYLKQCDLFERLGDTEAARLEGRALMRRFRRGAFVYAPTEPGQSVLVLAQGRVKIKDITPDGRETILAFIEPGELFGELAILDGQRRQDYAVAVEDSQVLLLPREEMVWLMERRSDVALSVTRLIGLRRQRIENRLRNVLFLGSRERMVRILLELAEAHGDQHGNRCVLRLPLSHQDLASLIGVTRETVTLTLGQLQAEGLVERGRKRLTIADVRRMRQEATGVAGAERGPPAGVGRAGNR